MRRIMLAGVAAIALLAGRNEAFAQAAVTCVNCSTIAEQLVQYAEQVNQLVQETATQLNTLNTYINAVTNTLSLPGNLYRDLTGDIQKLESIRETADLLTSQFSGPIIKNLSYTNGYPLGNITNWHQEITNEANAVALALTAAGGETPPH